MTPTEREDKEAEREKSWAYEIVKIWSERLWICELCKRLRENRESERMKWEKGESGESAVTGGVGSLLGFFILFYLI